MDSFPPESVEILDQIDEASTKSEMVELAEELKCSQQSDFDDGKLRRSNNLASFVQCNKTFI